MKSTWDIRQGKLVAGGNSKTEHDHLTLPGSNRPTDLSAVDLARVLQAAGVAGVSHSQGKDQNMAAYAKHIEQIRTKAADAAVAEWLAGK